MKFLNEIKLIAIPIILISVFLLMGTVFGNQIDRNSVLDLIESEAQNDLLTRAQYSNLYFDNLERKTEQILQEISITDNLEDPQVQEIINSEIDSNIINEISMGEILIVANSGDVIAKSNNIISNENILNFQPLKQTIFQNQTETNIVYQSPTNLFLELTVPHIIVISPIISANNSIIGGLLHLIEVSQIESEIFQDSNEDIFYNLKFEDSEFCNFNNEISNNYERNKTSYNSSICLPDRSWKISRIQNLEVVIQQIDQNAQIIYALVFFLIFLLTLVLFINQKFMVIRPIKKALTSFDAQEKIEITEAPPKESNFIEYLRFKSIILNNKYNELKKDFNIKVKDRTSALHLKLSALNTKISESSNSQLAILNVLEDLKESQQQTKEFAQELKKFKLAVENSSDVIFITDPEARIIYINPAVKKVLGYEVAETINKRPQELWGGSMSDEFYTEMWSVISTERKPFAGEVKNIDRKGNPKFSSVIITPIINPNDNSIMFYVAVQRDITEAKEIAERKSEFISLASHQIRTPISIIKWYLEILTDKSKISSLDSEQLEAIKYITDANQKMTQIINSLLNISRIESGRIIIDPKPTNINNLADNAIKELEPKIKEMGHKLEHKKLPEDREINIDPDLIHQSLLNLLSNAIKYTPVNGEIIVSHEILEEEGFYRISIADNGYGVSEKDQKDLFTKYFRSKNIKTKAKEGTGLGLYLVKTILESSQGRISMTSEIDQGSTFMMDLPLTGSKRKDGEVKLNKTDV